jgi:3-hydroxybutyryl-CoA dehydratase
MTRSIPPLTLQLTQERINQYADAAGDHNPIHVDDAFARATPFGGTIAHGMLVLASVSTMMTSALGERWLTSGRLKVRFRAPARSADAITASATAQAAKDGMDVYAVECRNAGGDVLINGTAEAPSVG